MHVLDIDNAIVAFYSAIVIMLFVVTMVTLVIFKTEEARKGLLATTES